MTHVFNKRYPEAATEVSGGSDIKMIMLFDDSDQSDKRAPTCRKRRIVSAEPTQKRRKARTLSATTIGVDSSFECQWLQLLSGAKCPV
ncbi:MAG: hypothetical protein PVG51_01990 [Desulfosarcina sp.]|jgi:hypothetical protein